MYKKNRTIPKAVILIIVMLMASGITVTAGNGVSWSPTKEAWTTDYGVAEIYQPKDKDETITFMEVDKQTAGKGQHVYELDRKGMIDIAYWKCVFREHYCIHNTYPDEPTSNINKDFNWRGFLYKQNICHKKNQPGWFAYCANCGRAINDGFVYATADTISMIKQLESGSNYAYLCPFSDNLEQARPIKHTCDSVSWNKYRIQYVSNGATGGNMANSTHMFNGETQYEGKKIDANLNISKNLYFQQGLEFVGWNTKPDGSGISFVDKEEFSKIQTKLNLGNLNNNERTYLYAQWRRSNSTLQIDAGGGTYQGPTSYTQDYRTSLTVDPNLLTAPAGPIVTFDPMGGNKVSSLTTTMSFTQWQMVSPFVGDFEGNTYTFHVPDKNVDTIKALYQNDAFTLPGASRDGYQFGGWYQDKECQIYVGTEGTTMTTSQNITLYAKWSNLILDSTVDTSGYGGRGAIDLTWVQNDSSQKVFVVRQYKEGGSGWRQIYSKDNVGSEPTVKEKFDHNGQYQYYTVPYDGIYNLTTLGAQGNQYGSYTGGLGGRVDGRLFLRKGEVLTIVAGGQNSYNYGGGATHYGNGGGRTEIYTPRLGTLLIAGGGGGAGANGNGGAGGSSASLTATGTGASGMSGGGGGNNGGAAGELVVHYHSNSCYHTTSLGYSYYKSKTSTEPEIKNNVGDPAVWYSNPNEYLQGLSGVGANGTVEVLGLGLTSIYIGGHSKDEGNNAWLSPRTASLSDLIPTNGNSSMTIQWYKRFWDNYGGPLKLYVYNQNGGLIYEEVTDYPSTNHIIKKTDITLPAGTTAVNIKLGSNWTNKDNCWYSFGISELTFKGGTQQSLICGYYDGQVISSKAAYGGSNFAAPSVNLISSTAGAQEGDGQVAISGFSLGAFVDNFLKGVKAPDEAAPNKVTLRTSTGTDTKSNIVWNHPGDNGTWYRHIVDSYDAGTNAHMLQSNITRDLVTTGIAKYQYIIDNSTGTEILSNQFGTTITGTALTVEKKGMTQWLHVAAVDKAGNIGPTDHIQVAALNETPQEPEIYPVYTNPIAISGEDNNIYRNGETYYVRADGKTPFYLKYRANIVGSGAQTVYQINYMDFSLRGPDGDSTFRIFRQNQDPLSKTDITFDSDGVTKTAGSPEYLQDASFTRYLRTAEMKDVEIYQGFTMDKEQNKKQIKAVPRAGIIDYITDSKGKTEVWSTEANDIANGISIIGDSEAPVIGGLDDLKKLTNIDVDDYEDFVLNLTAQDNGSGMKSFSVTILNKDNFKTATYDGVIQNGTSTPITIDILQDDSLFRGDLAFTVIATDNVGNVFETQEGIGEFTLNTKLESKFYDSVTYRRGETAFLTIRTSGYADRLTVKFPSQWNLDGFDTFREYNYFNPVGGSTDQAHQEELIKLGIRTEVLEFMIPLWAPQDDFNIKITAYKNGESIEVNQPHDPTETKVLERTEPITIKGSILDDFRTVIISQD